MTSHTATFETSLFSQKLIHLFGDESVAAKYASKIPRSNIWRIPQQPFSLYHPFTSQRVSTNATRPQSQHRGSWKPIPIAPQTHAHTHVLTLSNNKNVFSNVFRYSKRRVRFATNIPDSCGQFSLSSTGFFPSRTHPQKHPQAGNVRMKSQRTQQWFGENSFCRHRSQNKPCGSARMLLLFIQQ